MRGLEEGVAPNTGLWDTIGPEEGGALTTEQPPVTVLLALLFDIATKIELEHM